MRKEIDNGKIRLLSDKEFERRFIDEWEEKFFPLIISPFNEVAYLLLKDLEETFYPFSKSDELMIFIQNIFGFTQIPDNMRGKEDNLRFTGLYFMLNIGAALLNIQPQERVYILIKKDNNLRKRLEYIFQKNKQEMPPGPLEGPNSNFLSKRRINNRKPLDSRLRHEVFKRDNYICKECGAGKDKVILHVDHIIPLAKGGTDELSNLQTLCELCNLAKSDKYFIGGKSE